MDVRITLSEDEVLDLCREHIRRIVPQGMSGGQALDVQFKALRYGSHDVVAESVEADELPIVPPPSRIPLRISEGIPIPEVEF